ncbi:MAG: hypothetical protein KME54_21195 [Tolypothrix brevis GSE-NOS-MK-07-07A]|jgi:hypothetical protein|nr:hypothetical protein [Tolypothrix brevis GSE-NOS-MK-07-07A]
MNLKLLSLGIFSVVSVSPFLMPSFTPKAEAGCVAVDVGVQVAVDGSRRGSQSNNVSQRFDPNCSGGSVTSVGKQVCVSTKCEQRRTSNQSVSGNGRYTGGRNIPIRVNVPVHVHNPAADPNFPFNKR